MSLLEVLQLDIASMLMRYLDASHSELLEVARPLRNSSTFAWEACTQRGFNLFKVAEHLRGDALCRRTLELMVWSKNAFVRLWASSPEGQMRGRWSLMHTITFRQPCGMIPPSFEPW